MATKVVFNIFSVLLAAFILAMGWILVTSAIDAAETIPVEISNGFRYLCCNDPG